MVYRVRVLHPSRLRCVVGLESFEIAPVFGTDLAFGTDIGVGGVGTPGLIAGWDYWHVVFADFMAYCWRDGPS